jgi:hypothetical protein
MACRSVALPPSQLFPLPPPLLVLLPLLPLLPQRLIGYLFEHVGDLELTSYKCDPANRGGFLTRGVWGVTRHPNYFGNAVRTRASARIMVCV